MDYSLNYETISLLHCHLKPFYLITIPCIRIWVGNFFREKERLSFITFITEKWFNLVLEMMYFFKSGITHYNLFFLQITFFCILFTARPRSWGKVMFSVVFVCHSVCSQRRSNETNTIVCYMLHETQPHPHGYPPSQTRLNVFIWDSVVYYVAQIAVSIRLKCFLNRIRCIFFYSCWILFKLDLISEN